jgi:hypothetical protein
VSRSALRADGPAPRRCARCNGRGSYEVSGKNGQPPRPRLCTGCKGTGHITPARAAELIEAELRSRREADRVLLDYIVRVMLVNVTDARRVLELVARSLQARLDAFDPDFPEKGYLAHEAESAKARTAR